MISCLENNLKIHNCQHLIWDPSILSCTGHKQTSKNKWDQSNGAPLSPIPPANYFQPRGTFSARCNFVHLLSKVSTIRLMWIEVPTPICLPFKVYLGCCPCPEPLSVSFIIPYASKCTYRRNLKACLLWSRYHNLVLKTIIRLVWTATLKLV